ncbi:MAG: glycosyltransferase [Parabacteroides sp.]|nr:glycosyltransferase [Parabacteroides sp.]
MKSVLAAYLARQKSVRRLSGLSVSPELSIGIVIPCYNEPCLLRCLHSLAVARKPAGHVEVCIVVNAPDNAPAAAVARNRQTVAELDAFIRETDSPSFRVYYLDVTLLAGKYAGVGLARKIGMDEMIHRFAAVHRPEGVIVSLDADCEVSPEYLAEIEQTFCTPGIRYVAAVLGFEHPLPPAEEEPVVRKAMIQYELYLRYYKHALRYTGFPYPYYTIGSCFAVTAETYCRVGGMGKYQGGEDFYFLQKVFPLGKTAEIRTARVFPAAHLSDRVPFGTGPSLIRLAEQPEPVKYTYAWESFGWVRSFIASRQACFKQSAESVRTVWNRLSIPGRPGGLPGPFRQYLDEVHLAEAVEELGRNCASPAVFDRRFFEIFSALRILQTLNALQQTYPLQPVACETARLLNAVYGAAVPEEVHVSESGVLVLLRQIRAYE